jgi:hypothetical protein
MSNFESYPDPRAPPITENVHDSFVDPEGGFLLSNNPSGAVNENMRNNDQEFNT